MRKCIWMLLFSSLGLFSQVSLAKQHTYLGGSLFVANKTEFEVNNFNYSESNDISAGVYLGKNLQLAKRFNLGIDVEYQYLGEANIEDGFNFKAHAGFLNFRPRFLGREKVYTEFLAGVGYLRGEINSSILETDSKIAYQLGANVGYHFGNVDINLGYRYRLVELLSYDFEIHGALADIRYNFMR